MDQSSEAGSGSGSLILGMKAEADGALLLAYDTKVHDEVTKAVSQEWDIAEDRNVDKVCDKVQLAQYCALAIAGNASFGYGVHSHLLQEVLIRLEQEDVDQKQLLAKQATELIRDSIQQKVEQAKDGAQKEKIKSRAKRSKFIYGTWEKDDKGKVVPKLIPIVRGKVLDDVDYECFGIGAGAAYNVMKKWRHNMTIDEGVQLIQRAMAAAVKEDAGNLLGGRLRICVLKARDVSKLPLDIDEETLDRAITFIDVGPIVREST